MRKILLIATGLACFFGGQAHPVSLNWANARISDTQITLTYRFLAEDLVLFYQPAHDGFYNYSVADLRRLADDHAKTISQQFDLSRNGTDQLAPSITAVQSGSLAGDSIMVMDLMRYEIIVQLRYAFRESDWESLTFQQNLQAVHSAIPVVTFLSAYDQSTDLSLTDQLEMISGRPYTIRTGKPLESLDASAATSSFFTVTEKGVRHELTIPASVAGSLVSETKPGDTSFSSLLLSYFQNHNPVFHHSVRLAPELSFSKLLVDDASGEGLVYVDLLYRTAGQSPASDLHLFWEDYTWDFRWFNSSILLGDTILVHRFSRFQPVFLFHLSDGLEPSDR